MALTKPRLTPKRADGTYRIDQLGLKTSTTVFVGGLICVDSTGYAVPGATATGLHAIGILTNDQPDFLPGPSFTNSGASGSKTINVERGVFKLDNSGTDPVSVANNGAEISIEDDHTVCATATGKSIAGTQVGMDADGGVWVAIGSPNT
jgi:hypothetical protein